MDFKKFKVSGSDDSEEVSFGIPPGHKKVGVIIRPLTGSPKLYVLQESNSACVFCSLSSAFLFVGNKVAADYFKDEIIPSLKENNRLKLADDVA